MDFDISSTPTIEVVSTDDEQLLAQDLQTRVDETIRQVEAQPEVIAASEVQQQADDRLARLRKAERSLNEFAKEARQQTALGVEATVDAIVASATSGQRPDFKKANAVAALEVQNSFATRAIQRIIEHQIPMAQIASLRETSHALMTQARAIEKIAQERAEKLLGHLRDAVSEEMVLPVDMSKGVAGALLAHAGGWKKLALQLSENADELEKSYRERSGL
jgi:hypothetical protein